MSLCHKLFTHRTHKLHKESNKLKSASFQDHFIFEINKNYLGATIMQWYDILSYLQFLKKYILLVSITWEFKTNTLSAFKLFHIYIKPCMARLSLRRLKQLKRHWQVADMCYNGYVEWFPKLVTYKNILLYLQVGRWPITWPYNVVGTLLKLHQYPIENH